MEQSPEVEPVEPLEPALEKREKLSSKIELKFFRHDEKESDKSKSDIEIGLTPGGKMHAKDLATNEDIDQSIAFGSSRRRTQETAIFQMAGKLDDISGDETLEELRMKLNKNPETGYGSKVLMDKRLDFDIDVTTPYGAALLEASKKSEVIKFMIEQSDELARNSSNEETCTYSKVAAGVAQIVKKYVEIAPRFDALVHNETKDYRATMRRFLGTHQAIGECLLAKIIEKTHGLADRDAFVKALNNQGFGFSEGFTVDVVTKEAGEAPDIHVVYKKEGSTPETSFIYDEKVPIDIVEEIAAGK